MNSDMFKSHDFLLFWCSPFIVVKIMYCTVHANSYFPYKQLHMHTHMEHSFNKIVLCLRQINVFMSLDIN